MEVLNKSHYGNSHLQMRQKPIPIKEQSGQREVSKSENLNYGWPTYRKRERETEGQAMWGNNDEAS